MDPDNDDEKSRNGKNKADDEEYGEEEYEEGEEDEDKDEEPEENDKKYPRIKDPVTYSHVLYLITIAKA